MPLFSLISLISSPTVITALIIHTQFTGKIYTTLRNQVIGVAHSSLWSGEEVGAAAAFLNAEFTAARHNLAMSSILPLCM